MDIFDRDLFKKDYLAEQNTLEMAYNNILDDVMIDVILADGSRNKNLIDC